MAEMTAGLAATQIRAAVQDAVTIGHPLVDSEKANVFLKEMETRVDTEVKQEMSALIDRLLRDELSGNVAEMPNKLEICFSLSNEDLVNFFGKDGTIDLVTMRASLRHWEQDLNVRGGYQARVQGQQRRRDQWGGNAPLEVEVHLSIPLDAPKPAADPAA